MPRVLIYTEAVQADHRPILDLGLVAVEVPLALVAAIVHLDDFFLRELEHDNRASGRGETVLEVLHEVANGTGNFAVFVG